MTLSTLPYVTDKQELADAVTTLSNELLWRMCGYDERPPTAEDVADVLAGIDAARDYFLLRASEQVPAAKGHLRLVQDAG